MVLSKLMISLLAGGTAIVVFNPWAYKLTNWLTVKFADMVTSVGGCPNMKGLLLHAFVFFVVTFLMMLGGQRGVLKG